MAQDLDADTIRHLGLTHPQILLVKKKDTDKNHIYFSEIIKIDYT